MAANDSKDEFERVQERLTRARPLLSPTLGRAAAYLLEHPADVVTMSMREIARASDIPAPNFSRLADRIGFSGYDALRAVYRRRVHQGKPFADCPPAPAPSRPIREAWELWGAFRSASAANLAAAFDSTDAALVTSVANELRARERVHVAATHAAHHLVRYLNDVAGMASPSFRPLGLEGAAFGDAVVDIAARDALICLSSTPTDEALVELARHARDAGALVVGVVESRTTPLAAVCDRLLFAPADRPSFFPSRVAALAVLELLAGFVALRGGKAATERIDRIRGWRARFERP